MRRGTVCSGQISWGHREPPDTLDEQLFRDVVISTREVAQRLFGGATCYGSRVDVTVDSEGFHVHAGPVIYPPGPGVLSNDAGADLRLRVAVARLYEWCEWQDGEPWVAMTATIELSDWNCDDPWEVELWYAPR